MAERGRGAQRSEASRAAILGATARQFARIGYDSMTIEGIASEAGVGKQTIYRWWPSKSSIIAECLIEDMLFPEPLTPPDTGDLRQDLVTWLNTLTRVDKEQGGGAFMRSLIAAATENPAVGELFREAIGSTKVLSDRLDAALLEGQLRAGAGVREISEMLLGALIVRSLNRDPISPSEAVRFVDIALAAQVNVN